MKIELYKRCLGEHKKIKSVEIQGLFSNYCIKIDESKFEFDKYDNYEIKEQEIVDLLPKDFLPVEPENILLSITEGKYSTGQRLTLKIFKPWQKYFNCYSIFLINEEYE